MNKLLEKNGTAVCEDQYGKLYLHKENNESVVVLARHGDSLVLIQQSRTPVASDVIQLPGGGVQAGERLEVAARRELLEETGYECGQVQYLGKMFAASWISNEITHVFYTNEILSQSNQRLESHENIEVITMTVEECIYQIRENKLNDSELTFALLQAALLGLVELSADL